MAFRTCVDCSVYLPDQSMEGHPTFESEAAWLEHRHKSHGGAKPTAPAAIAKDAPAKKPGIAPEFLTRENWADFMEHYDRVTAETNSRLTALETQDTGLLTRVAALELKPTE